VMGAVIPDIDVAFGLFGEKYFILGHRAFTHSFLGILPMAFLAAGVVWLFTREWKDGASFKALWGMAILGVVSHLFLDVCTSWGTMLMWPLKTRYALDHLFIIDLWYMGLFILPLALSFLYGNRRTLICLLGLAGVGAYHGLAAYEHHRAMAVAGLDQPEAWRAALPEPYSPFRWSAFDRKDGLLRGARLDFLKSSDPLDWKEWREPPMTPDIQAALDCPTGKTYLWFARVPMWEAEKQPDGSTVVRFWDERFHLYMNGESTARRFGAQVRVKDGKVLDSRF
jgi:hypothetical protein